MGWQRRTTMLFCMSRSVSDENMFAGNGSRLFRCSLEHLNDILRETKVARMNSLFVLMMILPPDNTKSICERRSSLLVLLKGCGVSLQRQEETDITEPRCSPRAERISRYPLTGFRPISCLLFVTRRLGIPNKLGTSQDLDMKHVEMFVQKVLHKHKSDRGKSAL